MTSDIGPGVARVAAADPSVISSRVNLWVIGHLGQAEALGARIGRLTNNPEALASSLRRGLAGLAETEYRAGQRRVAPGIGTLHGVRMPLLDGVARAFRRAARGVSNDQLLLVADRLLREEEQEPHWLAMGILEGAVLADPERGWQLIRRAARAAGDWIAIDTLAYAAGRGILAEPYRWAEIEQLAFSTSRWERRLIGSTIATIPFVDVELGRRPEIAARGIDLLGQLIGDREPDVQKAIAWAYRSLLRVNPAAVERALTAEASLAARTGDGHRAWVIRNVLAKIRPETAGRLRVQLAGIRRRSDSPSTSRAARTATEFGGLPHPGIHPEPPLFQA